VTTMLKWLSFVILLSLFFGTEAQANTLTAASCNETDVASAVAQATNGDTVIIPSCPGGVTWTVQLNVTAGITLIGQGAGNTVITDNTSKGGSDCSGLQNALVNVSLTTNVFVRISGFTIIGLPPPGNCGESSNHIHVSGSSHQVRVDHITFAPPAVTGIETVGDTWGVIDHNIFLQNATKEVFSILVQHNSWAGVGSFGDNSWAQPDTLGQAGAVYIEDNTFVYPNGVNILTCIDSEAGGRFVFRHNTGCNSLGVHGMDSSGRLRSVRQWEVYNNDFVAIPSQPLGNQFTGFFVRGGTGVIWNNNNQDGISDPYITMTQLTVYRDSDSYPPWAGSTGQNGSTAWGANGCDGNSPYDTNDGGGSSSTAFGSGTASASSSLDNMTANGSPGWTTNQWIGYSLRNVTERWGSVIVSNTGNTITTNVIRQGSSTDLQHAWASGDRFLILHAYPCLDQTGRGMGNLFQNTNPVLASTGLAGAASQAIDPVYEWLNTHNGGTNFWGITSDSPQRVRANRDYYDYMTTFDGTSGIGSGLLSARPTTCTAGLGGNTQGVGYWATDTQTLYVCNPANTWTVKYTPYTYPHPLTLGQTSGTPPAAPLGVAVTSVQ
jgi:hypothetical protein